MIRYLFLLIFFSSLAQVVHASELDSLRELLFQEINRKSEYDAQKLSRIEAIKLILADNQVSPEDRFRYHQALIREYEKYSFDSTLHYIDINLRIAESIPNTHLANQALMVLASNMRNVGRSKEAEDILLKIDTSLLDTQGMIEYINTQRKLYEDLRFYAITIESEMLYEAQYQYYKDKLLALVSDRSEIYQDALEKDLLDKRKLDEALAINSRRLGKAQMGTPFYALVKFQRSLIYELNGDSEQRKKCLMLSAISDIRASIKDNASLTTLASILYEEGQIEDAYYYIQSAYEDAIEFNSGLRFQEISRILAPIATSFQQLSDQQQSRLRFNLVIISILGLVLLITVFFIYRQVKKLSAARNELRRSLDDLNQSNAQLIAANQKLESLYDDLSESNLVKEHYIANFLNIHSEYIDKIDRYQKLVKKMLMGRKFDQLLDQINSHQYVDSEIRSFYETFDKAFLTIYPDFISQLNALLRSAEVIELKEGELLNTELRIFALIRLGITDSSVIARLLRYSVNTIYNYRVKIKNKAAVPREDFEEQVQRIDSFQKR